MIVVRPFVADPSSVKLPRIEHLQASLEPILRVVVLLKYGKDLWSHLFLDDQVLGKLEVDHWARLFRIALPEENVILAAGRKDVE